MAENTTNGGRSDDCALIFISGERSHVGKSSVCLGLIGALLRNGIYQPSELAYIKPCTQCEGTTLVSKFCYREGVKEVGIGPVVFYTGFTRAFLDGQTETTEQMRQSVIDAVDKLKQGRKLVIVDGVGYPAVGSIIGLSNAHVAAALNAPVLIVGKPGVGDAVDSFNMNAVFFEKHNARVIGAIFNKLKQETYDDEKHYVSKYFELYRKDNHIYGFIPELAQLKEAEIDLKQRFLKEQAALNATPIDPAQCNVCKMRKKDDYIMTECEAASVEGMIQGFTANVNLGLLLQDIHDHHHRSTKNSLPPPPPPPPSK